MFSAKILSSKSERKNKGNVTGKRYFVTLHFPSDDNLGYKI